MNCEPTDSRYTETWNTVIRAASVALGVPAILSGEYRNPFHFIDEFDQWFEFERRRHFGKEPTHRIIADMLSDDLLRAARSMDTNYSALKLYANEHYGRYVPDNRSIIIPTN